MRPDIRQACKFMKRAQERLEQVGSTTVAETTKLLIAENELRKIIMQSGMRARESLRRDEEEEARKRLA